MYLLAVMIALSFGCWWVLAVMSLRDQNIRRLLWWLIPVFGQFVLVAIGDGSCSTPSRSSSQLPR
jgi:hypothetical protein